MLHSSAWQVPRPTHGARTHTAADDKTCTNCAVGSPANNISLTTRHTSASVINTIIPARAGWLAVVGLTNACRIQNDMYSSIAQNIGRSNSK